MAATFRAFVRKLHSSAPRFDITKPHNPEDFVAGAEMWEKVAKYVAFPAILLAAVNAYLTEKEHKEHYVRPEFIPYEHLNIRTKKFPWGDGNHSLFFNKRYNTTPNGYDDE